MKFLFVICTLISINALAGGHRVFCGTPAEPELICTDKNGIFLKTSDDYEMLVQIDDTKVYTNENRSVFLEKVDSQMLFTDEKNEVSILTCSQMTFDRCN